MAMLVSVLFFTGCDVSQYHYNLLCLMLYMFTITHLCAATMVRTYFKEILGVLRIALVILQFVFTGLLFQNRNMAEFATMDPRNHQIFNTSLAKPAACSSRGNVFGVVSTIIGSNRTIIDIGSTILSTDNITILDTTNTTYEINWTVFRSDRTKHGARNVLAMDEEIWYTLLMGLFPASLLLVFGHAIHCYLCKRRLQKAAYTSGLQWHRLFLWIRAVVLIAGGPEDQGWDYGQLISIFLLASVMFTVIQAAFEERAENLFISILRAIYYKLYYTRLGENLQGTEGWFTRRSWRYR
ncbi:hypothetical protein K440DRAFT_663662 [Wilcoxina mikolae CBS 423.85]|nr:hypothetical protein K440DRAFT_663662 [Wilcoxina mikolae CBS 423.85]